MRVAIKWNAFKKAQGVFGGGLMVVCAFVLMWIGVSSDVSTDNQLSGVVKKAIDIDAEHPDPNDNGKIVVAAAPWTTPDRYEDEFLRSTGPLLLQRRVEMLQWVEEQKEGSVAPVYTLQWVEGQVDFFRFQVPQGHENPLLSITGQKYQAQQSKFGAFNGSRLLSLIQKLELLNLTPEMLKDSSLEISENKLVLRRNPSMQLPSLGDTRVWYEALPPGDYTVLTVQEDERSLVGAQASTQLFVEPGLFDSSELLVRLEGGSDASFRRMLYLGGLLLCAGLLSLMMPHAPKFDLNPYMNVRGSLAVVIASFGLSFVVTALFFLLSFAR